MIVWEIFLVLLLLLWAAMAPRGAQRLRIGLRRRLRGLLRRPRLVCVLVGLVSLAISAGLGLFVRLHEPAVHDEFAYLLAGDTFARGRLTNPTHPLWEHFESFHIFHQPTYQAKYPPGQGLVLALGQRLGHPLLGVWLSLAAACAAACWMYQGWLPGRWALLAAAVTVAHYELLLHWGQTYWGGAVAMCGGALVAGCVPRLVRAPRTGPAIAGAAGAVILGISRPQEGFVVCCLALLGGGWLLVGRGRFDARAWLRRVVFPASLVLAAGGAWLLYYNWRLTGDPWTLPYHVGNSAVWDAARRHASMRRYVGSPPLNAVEKLLRLWALYWKVPLTWPVVLAFPWLLARRRDAVVLAWAAISIAVSVATSRAHMHYLAPVAPLLLMLPVCGLRRLQFWRRPRGRPGPALVLGFVGLLAFTSAWTLAARRPLLPPEPIYRWAEQRAQLLQRLEDSGGEHLVIVRYGQGHDQGQEWVYNGADIDSQPVVWARDMKREKNRRLLDYYPDRRVWLLVIDRGRPVLRPYETATSPGGPMR